MKILSRLRNWLVSLTPSERRRRQELATYIAGKPSYHVRKRDDGDFILYIDGRRRVIIGKREWPILLITPRGRVRIYKNGSIKLASRIPPAITGLEGSVWIDEVGPMPEAQDTVCRDDYNEH